jgi:hypothetical protein
MTTLNEMEALRTREVALHMALQHQAMQWNSGNPPELGALQQAEEFFTFMLKGPVPDRK